MQDLISCIANSPRGLPQVLFLLASAFSYTIPAPALSEGPLTARDSNIKHVESTGKSGVASPTKGSERSVQPCKHWSCVRKLIQNARHRLAISDILLGWVLWSAVFTAGLLIIG